MEILDHTYLTDLVIKSQHGSSNAFAELYASVCRQQYSYICRSLDSDGEAADILQEVFTTALHRLPLLQNPELFAVWITRISFLACLDRMSEKSIPGEILKLPAAESQVLVMHDWQKLSRSEIGDILNMSTNAVTRTLKLARKHLTRKII